MHSTPLPVTFHQSLNAIGLACLGWFFFCACDVVTKSLVQGYSAAQLLATNAIIGLALTGAIVLARHGWRAFLTPNWRWYLFRGVTVIGSSFCVVNALGLIPLADFYGIIFLVPMITTLIAVIFLKEHIGPWRWGAIFAGFLGVLIIAGPSFSENSIGYLYALAAALFAGTNALVIRKIGHEPVVTLYAFFPLLANAVFFVPLLFATTGFEMPRTGVDWSLFILTAPLAYLGMILYSLGFSRARDTSLVAPFHYSQMLWGVLFGLLFFDEIPGLPTVLGAMIIIGAGLLVIWREHLHHHKIATDPGDQPA